MNILFLGASNTDCSHCFTADNLGYGYVKYTAQKLITEFPDRFSAERITNGGTDGFTFPRMLRKWEQMYCNQRYKIVIILGGINEVGVIHNTGLSADDTARYLSESETALSRLISSVIKSGTDYILVCEPFLFPVPDYLLLWQNDLDRIRQMIFRAIRSSSEYCVSRLCSAGNHNSDTPTAVSSGSFVYYMKTQDTLDYYGRIHGLSAVTTDGIHLSDNGHMVLAKLLFQEICAMLNASNLF